jgi:serine O-acetyltransferase
MFEMCLTSLRTPEVSRLREHVGRQLAFLGWDANLWKDHEDNVYKALKRLRNCFQALKNKYYNKNGSIPFSPSHTGQYAIFLYYLSHTLKTHANSSQFASGVYALNKMLHSVDLFYEIELPNIFYLDHPLGSVIGRASFQDYFQFRQNCTVGNNKGIFPTFGKNVQLWSNVTVVGNCTVGDHVVFASGSYVKDQDIPSFSLVFGRSPNLTIKAQDPETAQNSSFFIFPNT